MSELLMVSPSSLKQAEREDYIENKYVSTKGTPILVLQDVIHLHPRQIFICLYMPQDIPNPWTHAILGLKNQALDFTLPTIDIIPDHITVSLAKAIICKDLFHVSVSFVKRVVSSGC
jgi:hypothetical protein